MSRSDADRYCVPVIHCKLLIIGLAGTTSSGLIRLSCVDCESNFPVPQTLRSAISEGDVHARTSPSDVTIEDDARDISIIESSALLISLRPGNVKARTTRSPDSVMRAWPVAPLTSTREEMAAEWTR